MGIPLHPDERDWLEQAVLAFAFGLSEIARAERWPIPHDLLEWA